MNPTNPYINDMQYKKPKTSVPAWVWIFSVLMTAASVVVSYLAGSVSAEMVKTMFIPDKNGDSTELAVLDFSDFLYVFDGGYGYNELDSIYYSLSYSSTRHFSNATGTYENRFSGECDFSASFQQFNYYEVPWIYEASSREIISLSFDSDIKSGNFQARVYALDKNYRVTEGEDGMMYIKNEYLVHLWSFSANTEDTYDLNIASGCYYLLVIGAESATGSYDFSVSALS